MIAQFACRRHHPLTTMLFVVGFWVAAAALVTFVHVELDARSVPASAAVSTAALVLTAFCYAYFVAREAGSTHALGVGVAWLVLSIAAEMAISARTGHPWYDLLGSPDQPLVRNLFLFVWIFAPALFARRGGE